VASGGGGVGVGVGGGAPAATPAPDALASVRRIPVRVHRATTPGPDPTVPLVLPTPTAIASGAPSFGGTVFADDGFGDVALASAVVRTSDGRVAISGADGRFTLPGSYPADGVFMTTRDGYASSTVADLAAAGALVLHVRSAASDATPDDVPVGFAFVASGTVLDPGGQPAADVEVSLADAHGAYGMPARTDAGGRYRLQLYSPDGRFTNATLYASGAAGLGLLAGLAPDEAAPDLPPLTLVAADHGLQVSVANAPAGVPAERGLDLVGADGTSVNLPEAADGWHLANVPGAHYRLRVRASDLNRGVESTLLRDPLPVDFTSANTSWPETLLDVPQPALPPALAPGGLLQWQAVAGASAYRVEASALSGSSYGWEGVSANPGLRLPPDAVPAGSYRVVYSALDGPGLTPRALAAVDARPRRLIVLPTSEITRTASRFVQVQVP
jgi:hypothetical protein